MKKRVIPSLHPASRFVAPRSITPELPMKHLFDDTYLDLLAESFSLASKSFNHTRFVQNAWVGLEDLELMKRASHIAAALRPELPDDFDEAAEILIQSMGPPLQKTEGNGLATFFYLPHSNLIAEHGTGHFKSAMRANYELTKRFSAEFSVRPFIARHERPALAMLLSWTKDRDPHVRRLASEGSRSRLPWGMRLRNIQANPKLTLPLLERLKDDPCAYVRRSVANHLGDILKDHVEIGYATCEKWIDEAMNSRWSADKRKSRCWIVRHALRLPAKKGDERALSLRMKARV